MRVVIAKMNADRVLLERLGAAATTAAGIDCFRRRVDGRDGVIFIDRERRCASDMPTPRMIHGWIEHGRESMARF